MVNRNYLIQQEKPKVPKLDYVLNEIDTAFKALNGMSNPRKHNNIFCTCDSSVNFVCEYCLIFSALNDSWNYLTSLKEK